VPLRISTCFYLLSVSLISYANEVDTLIESSFLVQIDKSVENSKRRYSTSFEPFGKEASISSEYDRNIASMDNDLLISLSTIYSTLDENALFDAFDHSLSYSIDLKNNGSYGDDNSEIILLDNLQTALIACLQSAEALNVPLETTLSKISSRIIGNFLIKLLKEQESDKVQLL